MEGREETKLGNQNNACDGLCLVEKDGEEDLPSFNHILDKTRSSSIPLFRMR